MTIEELLAELEGRDENTDVFVEVFNDKDDVVEVVIMGVRFEDNKIIIETEHP